MSRTGLTLVEVLVGLLVIAVAFIALASTQISNMKVTRDSKLASISMQVANEAMERATKLLLEQKDAFMNPTFDCGTLTLPCSGSFTDISIDGVTYEATYQITAPAGTAADNLAGVARIDVSVATPKPVEFSQYASCVDVVPPPSFSDPAPCPEPASGGG